MLKTHVVKHVGKNHHQNNLCPSLLDLGERRKNFTCCHRRCFAPFMCFSACSNFSETDFSQYIIRVVKNVTSLFRLEQKRQFVQETECVDRTRVKAWLLFSVMQTWILGILPTVFSVYFFLSTVMAKRPRRTLLRTQVLLFEQRRVSKVSIEISLCSARTSACEIRH